MNRDFNNNYRPHSEGMSVLQRGGGGVGGLPLVTGPFRAGTPWALVLGPFQRGYPLVLWLVLFKVLFQVLLGRGGGRVYCNQDRTSPPPPPDRGGSDCYAAGGMPLAVSRRRTFLCQTLCVEFNKHFFVGFNKTWLWNAYLLLQETTACHPLCKVSVAFWLINDGKIVQGKISNLRLVHDRVLHYHIRTDTLKQN